MFWASFRCLGFLFNVASQGSITVSWIQCKAIHVQSPSQCAKYFWENLFSHSIFPECSSEADESDKAMPENELRICATRTNKEKCFRIKLFHLQKGGVKGKKTTNLWNWKNRFAKNKITVSNAWALGSVGASFAVATSDGKHNERPASAIVLFTNFKDSAGKTKDSDCPYHKFGFKSFTCMSCTCGRVNERYRLSHKEAEALTANLNRIKYDWGRLVRRGGGRRADGVTEMIRIVLGCGEMLEQWTAEFMSMEIFLCFWICHRVRWQICVSRLRSLLAKLM